MLGSFGWAVAPLVYLGVSKGYRWRSARSWLDDVIAGPPPRADRGEVRNLVLDAISDRARHGYDVIQTIQDRSKGRYRPSPGVIYPTLQMLVELGHARVVDIGGRSAYAITDSGLAELQANRAGVEQFYGAFGESPSGAVDADLAGLMGRAVRLVATFKRLGKAGILTPAVMAKIRGALDDALEKIEKAFDSLE